MFIHRDTYKRDEPDDGRGGSHMPAKGLAEIIVAKHRNGPTGTVKLVYHEDYMRFVNAPSGGAIADAVRRDEDPPL